MTACEVDSSQAVPASGVQRWGLWAGELPGFAQLVLELIQAGQPGCQGGGQPSLGHKPPKCSGLKLHSFTFLLTNLQFWQDLCGLLLSAVCSVSWGGSRVGGVRVT